MVEMSVPYVVIVNDAPTQLLLQEALVRDAGFEVQSFSGAEEALKAMNPAAPPALIMTDLNMPGIDGWQFCRLLRSREYAAFNQVPLLVFSASFTGLVPEKIAAEFGVESFLSYPINEKQFIERVRNIVLHGVREISPLRVLIVENDSAFASTLQELFTENGYLVETVSTIRDALKLFPNKSFDIAVLDHHLSDGVGTSLLDTFRDESAGCLCVMMTSDPNPNLALGWMRRGAAAYVHKPFNPGYLLELCSRALRERTLRRVENLLEERTREVRESEERFQRIYTQSPVGVVLVDIDLRFLHCNDAFCRLVGYTEKELQAKTVKEIAYPPDQEVGQPEVRAILAGEAEQAMVETRYLRKDGEIVWGSVTFRLTHDYQGRPASLLALVQDITERKRAEEQERVAQAKYRVLFESLPLGVTITGNSGEIIEINQSSGRILGLPRNTQALQTLNRAPWKTVRPDGTPMPAREYAGMLALRYNRPVDGVEMGICRDSGEIRWLNVSAAPIPLEGYGAVVTYSDITERKRTEDSLRIASLYSRNLIETSLDPLVTISAEGKIMDVNRATEKVTGLGREQLIGTDFADYFTDPALARAGYQKVFSQGQVTGYPLAIRHASGILTDVLYNASVFRNEQGGVLGVFAAARDITELKQAEEQLRASEERMSNAFQYASIGMAFVGTDGRWMKVNPALVRLLGYTEEELLAKTFQDITHPDDLDTDLDYVRRILQGEITTYQMEKRYFHRNGGIVWVLLSVSLVRDSQGNPLHFISQIQDITARKQAEEARLDLERQLQRTQKAESLGRMAGAIAHHFNNQLQAVSGFLELAMDKLAPGTGLWEDITEAMNAARRAAQVSGLMLTYLGQSHGEKMPLNLSDVCRQSLPMFESLLPKNVLLEADFPADGPRIRANANQMQQILTNLLTNAWEAMGKRQGAVRLVVRTVHPSGIPATRRVFPAESAFGPRPYACLEVIDSGCGMADEEIDKIFDPFYSSKFTGRGMGLSVVLGIVREHEGVITVESQQGLGSSFHVYLPQVEDAVSREEPVEEKIRPGKKSGTMLLVEDEEPVRQVTTALLEHLGFMVLSAKDGMEAVQMFRQHAGLIQWVLCDLSMPRMNGWETLVAIRQLAPDIPVILASGYSEELLNDGDYEERPQAFLCKPYRRTELCRAIESILPPREGTES